MLFKKFFRELITGLTLFRLDILGTAHGWWGEGGVKRYTLPKICHTYPTMMKLGNIIPYLKKIKKICKSHETLPEFCWHQHFFTTKSANFVISRNTDLDSILVYNF